MPERSYSKSYAVAFVTLVLAWPLWREFHEPTQPVWNIFLACLLIALVMGVFFGLRYIEANKIDVGEAQFRSSNSDQQAGP